VDQPVCCVLVMLALSPKVKQAVKQRSSKRSSKRSIDLRAAAGIAAVCRSQLGWISGAVGAAWPRPPHGPAGKPAVPVFPGSAGFPWERRLSSRPRLMRARCPHQAILRPERLGRSPPACPAPDGFGLGLKGFRDFLRLWHGIEPRQRRAGWKAGGPSERRRSWHLLSACCFQEVALETV
jgi:hypothetical protein